MLVWEFVVAVFLEIRFDPVWFLVFSGKIHWVLFQGVRVQMHRGLIHHLL